MHLSLGHQFVVGKIQRSWWCRRSFRSWCQAPRCACSLLHSYSRDNFDCRSIRAIVIVSEKADPVICSIPLAKSRVTHCSVQTGRHCVSAIEFSVLTHHRILTPPPIVQAMPEPSQVWRIDSSRRLFGLLGEFGVAFRRKPCHSQPTAHFWCQSGDPLERKWKPGVAVLVRLVFAVRRTGMAVRLSYCDCVVFRTRLDSWH
jgi:hypothetical protein